jgi:hypothetical protein
VTTFFQKVSLLVLLARSFEALGTLIIQQKEEEEKKKKKVNLV